MNKMKFSLIISILLFVSSGVALPQKVFAIFLISSYCFEYILVFWNGKRMGGDFVYNILQKRYVKIQIQVIFPEKYFTKLSCLKLIV